MQSIRLETGQEALVARVQTKDGRAGLGFSFRLDAAEARHMAEWHAGARAERPHCDSLLNHPWETAYREGRPVPWDAEPGFTKLSWLPA